MALSKDTEAVLRRAMDRIDARNRIERAYQRAMDIRDTLGSPDPATESRYGKAYRKAFKEANDAGFLPSTRQYLKILRKSAKAEKAGTR